MLRLLLATRNAHKTREFAQILGSDFVVEDLSAATNIPAPEETGETFAENATLKALAASRIFAGLIVADDSGLSVAALQGAPGVRSARYAGENASDRDNVTKLLADLAEADQAQYSRAARFECALALAEKGKIVRLFEGAVTGRITAVPSGRGGFGYDPVFVPDGHTQTFAELSPETKNFLSHRAGAIAELRSYFRARR